MDTFKEMGLSDDLLQTLQQMQFHSPTPIQAEAIPLALEGRDILGSAQTGTGKTGAFGIPLVAKLNESNSGSALIIVPTRELATQVLAQLTSLLGKKSKIKTALLIGGDSIMKQLKQLQKYPRLIVGTPGRINDHLHRRSLKLNDVSYLVLDETDRMLDMGFSIQIESIMDCIEHKPQTLLFSATMPKNIVHIANKYLEDPVRVAVNSTSILASNITQENIHVTAANKYDTLRTQLNQRDGSIVVFVRTKHDAERISDNLVHDGYSANTIHGNLRQKKRESVIRAFRQKKYRILVATDIASRGLDIPHIEHVINYDLPQCAEDYIHRIGRTARAGTKGAALNLLVPSDKFKMNEINRLINPEAYKNSPQSPRGGRPSQPSSRKPGNRGGGKPPQRPRPKTRQQKEKPTKNKGRPNFADKKQRKA